MLSILYASLIIVSFLRCNFATSSLLRQPSCYYRNEQSNCLENNDAMVVPYAVNDLIKQSDGGGGGLWPMETVGGANSKQDAAVRFVVEKLLKSEPPSVGNHHYYYSDDVNADNDNEKRTDGGDLFVAYGDDKINDDDDGNVKDDDGITSSMQQEMKKEQQQLSKRSRYYQKYPRKRQQNKEEIETSYPQCIPTPRDTMNLIFAVHQIRRGVYPNYVPFCNQMRDARVILPNPRFLGKRNNQFI